MWWRAWSGPRGRPSTRRPPGAQRAFNSWRKAARTSGVTLSSFARSAGLGDQTDQNHVGMVDAFGNDDDALVPAIRGPDDPRAVFVWQRLHVPCVSQPAFDQRAFLLAKFARNIHFGSSAQLRSRRKGSHPERRPPRNPGAIQWQ